MPLPAVSGLASLASNRSCDWHVETMGPAPHSAAGVQEPVARRHTSPSHASGQGHPNCSPMWSKTLRQPILVSLIEFLTSAALIIPEVEETNSTLIWRDTLKALQLGHQVWKNVLFLFHIWSQGQILYFVFFPLPKQESNKSWFKKKA